MPTKPMRPCNQQGCPELISEGRYCEKHRKEKQKVQDYRRGSAASRGYDSRWQKARLAFLKLHPLCVECAKEHKTTAATVVDHIVPHKGDKQLFWDVNNWQPLCDHHHAVKTAKEDGGFGNRTKVNTKFTM